MLPPSNLHVLIFSLLMRLALNDAGRATEDIGEYSKVTSATTLPPPMTYTVDPTVGVRITSSQLLMLTL